MTDPPVELNYRDETMNFNTALHMASANGHLEVVKLLLAQKGIDLNVRNDTGNTAIHYAALNGKEEIVQLLVTAGADVNIKNEFGRIAIEDALQAGKGDIAEILAPASKLDEEKVYS